MALREGGTHSHADPGSEDIPPSLRGSRFEQGSERGPTIASLKAERSGADMRVCIPEKKDVPPHGALRVGGA